MCVGVHGTALFIPYFTKGKPTEVFMRTSKHGWNKAVAEYAVAADIEARVSCNWPLETHYRKAVGPRLHSWAIEQGLKLLSPVKTRMTPAERLAFGSSKQAPGGRRALPASLAACLRCLGRPTGTLSVYCFISADLTPKLGQEVPFLGYS